MKSINDVLNFIKREKIIVEEVSFKNRIDGIYFKEAGLSPIIGINKNLVHNKKKYLSVLAEELGHHFTTSRDLTAECVTYADKLIRNKEELKAKRWAANYLITDKEFASALWSKCKNIYEMAEYFNVSEEIIKIKIMNIEYNEILYSSLRSYLKSNFFKYDACNI